MTATIEHLLDLADIRFNRIFDERFTNKPDKIGTFWNMQPTTQLTERFSSLGTFGDMEEFSGTIRYDDIYQGYDTTTNIKEFAKGFAITRKLIEYDQSGHMDWKPKALAGSLYRKRQTDAARPFNNAASVEGYFYNNTEAVALVSNSHTTTSGASTASGFDNLTTATFSATALAASRIQMVNFRGDRAERISVNPTMIVHPVDLYQTIHEVTKSAGLPDSAYNNSNVHMGAYRTEEWIELSRSEER